MTALASHYAPDPDAMTPREAAIVEAWNAAYPQDAVDVTVWGHGKIAMRAVFEAEAAERNGNTEQAATFRALEAAAQAATANRVEAIREMLG